MTATERDAAVPSVNTDSACDAEKFLVDIQDWPVTSELRVCAEPLASRYLRHQWLVHPLASVQRTDEFIVLRLLCLNVTFGPSSQENKIY